MVLLLEKQYSIIREAVRNIFLSRQSKHIPKYSTVKWIAQKQRTHLAIVLKLTLNYYGYKLFTDCNIQHYLRHCAKVAILWHWPFTIKKLQGKFSNQCSFTFWRRKEHGNTILLLHLRIPSLVYERVIYSLNSRTSCYTYEPVLSTIQKKVTLSRLCLCNCAIAISANCR